MLPIEQKLITCNYEVRANRQIEFIVIHYDAGRNGNAMNTVIWFGNPQAQSSAHYDVDKAHIYQTVLDKNKAWHCGTKGVYKHPDCRNENSIGIEIASVHPDKKTKNVPAEDPNWSFDEQAIDNTVDLVASLMKKYNIPLDNVIRHYDVTGKICPAPYVNDESKWLEFKDRVAKKFNEGDSGKDVDDTQTPSAWAKESWDKAVKAGILDGTYPHNPLTREQLAVVLDRLGLIKEV